MTRPGNAVRAGSQVIPSGWETHHRPVPDGAMTATITISLPDTTGTWDAGLNRTVYATPTVLWTGQARVQAIRFRPAMLESGERPVTVRRFNIHIPLDCPPVPVGASVDVTAATDTQAEALALRVIDNPGGSLLWQRVLLCEYREPQN